MKLHVAAPALVGWLHVLTCPECGTTLQTSQYPFAADALRAKREQLRGFHLRARGKQRDALAVQIDELGSAIRALGGE